MTEYVPIVIMAILAVVFAVASMLASRLLRPHHPNPVKLSAYECGNDPVRLPRGDERLEDRALLGRREVHQATARSELEAARQLAEQLRVESPAGA